MKVVLFSLAVITLSGCTGKDLYNKSLNDQKRECLRNATSPHEMEYCEQQAQKSLSYEDYEKQRNEVIQGK